MDRCAPLAGHSGTGHAETTATVDQAAMGRTMTAQDRERFERALRMERRRIVASLLEFDDPPATSPTAAPRPPRPVPDHSEGTLLFLIDEALCTLYTDPDRFGICRGCGEPIDEAMLDAAPWVDLCPSCEREAAVILGLGS